jgi:3-oxoacyl-[acyl-carrier-protein] synthase-3
MKNNVKIIGTGYYVPGDPVPNSNLINNINTTDEWITENTGIKQRHISGQGENSSYLGSIAAIEAIGNSGLKPYDIDMLIVATATPDKLSPSTACIMKGELNMVRAIAFDISAVCSGFLFGMSVAAQYISSGMVNNVVVVGVDVFSTITDWSRRDCIFFGDGAGAVVMQKSKERGFIGFSLYSDSIDRVGFYCNHGEKFNMITRSVYDTALRVLPIAINGVLEKNNMTLDQVDYIIPHQPSRRILVDLAKVLNIPEEKVLMNMDKYANTVAGTIPILLHETWPKLKKGDIVLFAAIGSGWTYGAAIYEV